MKRVGALNMLRDRSVGATQLATQNTEERPCWFGLFALPSHLEFPSVFNRYLEVLPPLEQAAG